jgi:hypothetical protein
MKRGVAVMLVALVLPAAALGANPAGVHEVPALERAASWIAQRPVTVWCGDDDASWTALTASLGVPAGFSDLRADRAYLAPVRCDALAAWPNESPREFGPALLTLVHEAVHLSRVLPAADEGGTDCTALSDIWAVAFLFFGVGQPLLSDVYASALATHLLLPEPNRHRGWC